MFKRSTALGRSDGSGAKMSNGLVALGSAAVLTIYSAGYFRTREAAERFALQPVPLRAATREREVPAAPPSATPAPSSLSSSGASAPAPTEARVAPNAGRVLSDTPSVSKALPKSAAVPELPVLTDSTATVGADQFAAEGSVIAAPEVAPPPASPYKDGTFTGWGYSRHGDLEATIVMQGGKISSSYISQCLTRYPCSVIAWLPAQVVTRQSDRVDLVSGATESAIAFADAIYRALETAKR